jgi:YD repeat-containing protein
MGGSLAQTELPAAISTTAYNANNQLTTWGTANLYYDANGNMTSDGTNSYSWNARNQLASMNFNNVSFQYDGYGRRTGKTTSGSTTNYLYDEASHRADGLWKQLKTDWNPEACVDQESRAFSREIPVIEARLQQLAGRYTLNPEEIEEKKRLEDERGRARDLSDPVNARTYCNDTHKHSLFYP